MTVKDLVTLLIDSEGPVEQYAVMFDPGDGAPLVHIERADLDAEHKALILEKE